MTASIRKFQQDILDESNLNHLLNEAYAISIKIKDKKWKIGVIMSYQDILMLIVSQNIERFLLDL